MLSASGRPPFSNRFQDHHSRTPRISANKADQNDFLKKGQGTARTESQRHLASYSLRVAKDEEVELNKTIDKVADEDWQKLRDLVQQRAEAIERWRAEALRAKAKLNTLAVKWQKRVKAKEKALADVKAEEAALSAKGQGVQRLVLKVLWAQLLSPSAPCYYSVVVNTDDGTQWQTSRVYSADGNAEWFDVYYGTSSAERVVEGQGAEGLSPSATQPPQPDTPPAHSPSPSAPQPLSSNSEPLAPAAQPLSSSATRPGPPTAFKLMSSASAEGEEELCLGHGQAVLSSANSAGCLRTVGLTDQEGHEAGSCCIHFNLKPLSTQLSAGSASGTRGDLALELRKREADLAETVSVMRRLLQRAEDDITDRQNARWQELERMQDLEEELSGRLLEYQGIREGEEMADTLRVEHAGRRLATHIYSRPHPFVAETSTQREDLVIAVWDPHEAPGESSEGPTLSHTIVDHGSATPRTRSPERNLPDELREFDPSPLRDRPRSANVLRTCFRQDYEEQEEDDSLGIHPAKFNHRFYVADPPPPSPRKVPTLCGDREKIFAKVKEDGKAKREELRACLEDPLKKDPEPVTKKWRWDVVPAYKTEGPKMRYKFKKVKAFESMLTPEPKSESEFMTNNQGGLRAHEVRKLASRDERAAVSGGKELTDSALPNRGSRSPWPLGSPRSRPSSGVYSRASTVTRPFSARTVRSAKE